ncbi:histone-fold-containing protein [Crucibulum laeve]|uniref:DNA polymerase epsilon subunit D n=1 Tax=Crucibulum laeve TaxID=68775 RepID=A0A5C3M308_9AGAR|nr:histone-fold-containing protein [Crucibulum laeve]
MPRKDLNAGPISAQAQQDLVSEGIENFELPKSIVTKIAKSSIPDNAKLQKDTVLSLMKGSTVFINYLGIAHDVAQSKQHKSISASDVLKALEMIEFGDLVDKLQAELVVYRDLSKSDKGKKSASVTLVAPKPPAADTTPTSISASIPTTKSKGKGKATNSLVPPFTSAPLVSSHAGSSISGAGPMDIDEELTPEASDEEAEPEGDEEGIEDDGELEGVEEEIEEDDDDEDEEVEDRMAVEEEEIRIDAKGLDLPPQAIGDDDD